MGKDIVNLAGQLLLCMCALVLNVGVLPSLGSTAYADPKSSTQSGSTIGRSAYFEKNIGQSKPDVLYVYRSHGYRLSLLSDGAVISMVSAQTSGLFDPRQLIENQREQYLQSLHDLNNLVLQLGISEDNSKLLLIQGAILHLKADLEWLDLCEDVFE